MESAGGNPQENITADTSQKHGLHRRTKVTGSAECTEWRTYTAFKFVKSLSNKNNFLAMSVGQEVHCLTCSYWRLLNMG